MYIWQARLKFFYRQTNGLTDHTPIIRSGGMQILVNMDYALIPCTLHRMASTVQEVNSIPHPVGLDPFATILDVAEVLGSYCDISKVWAHAEVTGVSKIRNNRACLCDIQATWQCILVQVLVVLFQLIFSTSEVFENANRSRVGNKI